MKFYGPTKVYVEKECVRNHKGELTSLGSKALIITGRHSAAANGSLADVTSVLEEAGVPYVVFSEVEENPSVETVGRAGELGKKEKADFVIGIGGGSPLDAAKGAAILLGNPEETEDCLYAGKDLKPVPFAAVPTTCGTGSEVTPNAVLTRPALGKKGSMSYDVYPQVALVDGKYLAFASKKLIINTSVDALAHLVESRLSTKTNRYNQMFSEYGISLWSELIPFLTGEREPDADAFEKFMLTSTIAGMAIAQTGTSLPHALSYPITLGHNVPHGRACGLYLAAYMEEYARNKPEDVEKIMNLLGFGSLMDFSAFLQGLMGPQIVSREEMAAIADEISGNPGKLASFPFGIDRDGVFRIVERSLTVG